LFHAAQARAAINSRPFVIPDDVKYMAPYVLGHRLVVHPHTRLRGRRPEDVTAEIVAAVPVPVEEN
jgi:MoxR-like ATPase